MAKASQQQIIAQLTALHPALAQRYGVASFALFGSVARNQHTATSDVDLLVSFSQPIGLEFFDLEAELSQHLGLPVDLLPREGIKPHYWQRLAADVVEIPHG
jgi:predicted nucleotidyltransferase